MSSLSPSFPLRRILAVCVIAVGSVSSTVLAQVPESILNEDPAVGSAPRIPDRVEGLNRFFFKFNDGFYRFALRPISKGYAAVVPQPVRRGIGNFFNNLGYPTRLAGNLLEGEGKGALRETGRFLVNTTVGVAGFFQVADEIPELRVPPSDIGQAFATWGLGHGTYLVLPLMGPTSLRDGIGGGIGGVYLSPVKYLPEWEYSASARALDVINESPELMKNYFNFTSSAIDPYAGLRDAFSARRAQQVRERLSTTPAPEPAAATIK